MKLQIFSIFDEKAQTFNKPQFLVHKGEAIRSFQDICQNKETLINKHPEDYKLYNLGTLDDSSGELISLPQPEFINNATDFIVQ